MHQRWAAAAYFQLYWEMPDQPDHSSQKINDGNTDPTTPSSPLSMLNSIELQFILRMWSNGRNVIICIWRVLWFLIQPLMYIFCSFFSSHSFPGFNLFRKPCLAAPNSKIIEIFPAISSSLIWYKSNCFHVIMKQFGQFSCQSVECHLPCQTSQVRIFDEKVSSRWGGMMLPAQYYCFRGSAGNSIFIIWW